jgi:hypothetical protein
MYLEWRQGVAMGPLGFQPKTLAHQPLLSMQCDLCIHDWRIEIQALHRLAQHGDAPELSVVASGAELKRVGALECEAPVWVARQFHLGEGSRVVQELHPIRVTLAAGALHSNLADARAFKPEPEKAAQSGDDGDVKPRHGEEGGRVARAVGAAFVSLI